MKAIVLAAGQGTRLRPLTDKIPKCMVKFNEKPLLEYQLEQFEKNNIKNIAIATGYKSEKIPYNIKNFFNSSYDKTNMVVSLFCAQDFMDDDLIISYGDIIYNSEVLEKLIASDENISVVVDKNWKEYWQTRMDNPLDDAESLKINENGHISELGKKTTSYDDVQGQYIGLIKIKKSMLVKVINFYHSLDKTASYDKQSFDNMYMTSFLQLVLDNVCPISPVFIQNGWLEVDSVEDLEHYHKMLRKGELDKFYKIENSVS
jgi:choline kinase